MAIYPHTSDQKHKSFTDFSLKKDNDVRLSTRAISEFTTDTNLHHIGYRSGSLGTHSGWDTGSNIYDPSGSKIIVFQYISSSLFTEYEDPNNRLVNINVGNFWGQGNLAYLGRVFKVPSSGIYSFSSDVDGIAKFSYDTFNLANLNKGGMLSLQLRKYEPDPNYVSGYSPQSEVIYETEPAFYDFNHSSSLFSTQVLINQVYTVGTDDPNTEYTVEVYNTSSGFPGGNNWQTWSKKFDFRVPFGYEESYDYADAFSLQQFNTPLDGDYKFQANLRGYYNQHLSGYFVFGYGAGQTAELTGHVKITAKLVKREPAFTFPQYTTTLLEHSEIISLSQDYVLPPGNYSPGHYSDHNEYKTGYFDLINLFSDETITLQEGERVFVELVVESTNINGDPTATETDFTPIQNVALYNDALSGVTAPNNTGPSFFACISSIYSGDLKTKFNISIDDEEFQLFENDAVFPVLKVRGVTPEEYAANPNNRKQGLFIDELEFGDHKTFLKKTFSQSNVMTIGSYLSMDNADGHDHYQPLKGSFYVDLSDVQASTSHPVLVQVPLHGFSKYTDLNSSLDIHDYDFNQPNSRRFLNNSLELNVSTFSNRVANRRRPGLSPLNHNSILTGLKRATNVTYHANFVHYGSGFTELSYNSAPITRFDSWGTGFTADDLIDSPLFDFLPNEDIIAIDDFGYSFDNNSEINSIFGIYQGPGQVSGIPAGANIAPRIRLASTTETPTPGINVILPYKTLYDNLNAGFSTGPLPFVAATVADTPWPYGNTGLQTNPGEGNDLGEFTAVPSDPLAANLGLSYKNWHVEGPFPFTALGAEYPTPAPTDPPTAYYKSPYTGTYGFTYKLSIFCTAAGVGGAFQNERIRVKLRKSPYSNPTNITTIAVSNWISVSNNIFLTQDNTISTPSGHMILYQQNFGLQNVATGYHVYSGTLSGRPSSAFLDGVNWVDMVDWYDWGWGELNEFQLQSNVDQMNAYQEWVDSFGVDSVPDPQAGIIAFQGGFVQSLEENDKVWIEIEFGSNPASSLPFNISTAEILMNSDPDYNINENGMVFGNPPPGFSVYPPFSSFNTIQPVYEFMVTSNNPKTIVKGTYNYY